MLYDKKDQEFNINEKIDDIKTEAEGLINTNMEGEINLESNSVDVKMV